MLKLQHGTTYFIKEKYVSVWEEKILNFFLETKRKMCLDEMDGILCELPKGVPIPA